MRYLLYIAIYASVLLGQEDTRTALFYATPSSENTTFEGHDIYYNGTSGNIIAETSTLDKAPEVRNSSILMSEFFRWRDIYICSMHIYA